MMAGFDDPILLLFLVAIPVLFYLYNTIINKKRKEAMSFSNLSYIKSAMGNDKKIKRSDILFYTALLVLVFMIIGFANPHIPLKLTKEGVNVVLVLDVSGSMQAQDYKPTRHEASKLSASTLVESLETKDNVGVVIFESGATTAAYRTPDKKKVIEKIKSIAPKEGRTAIGDGLSLGIDMATS